MFPPEHNYLFSLLGQDYRIEEHPRFAGVPYGQEGRQGTVYKIVRQEDHESFALKVFRPSFRYPTVMKKSEVISRYSSLAGLKSGSRRIIHPQESKELLSTYPELLYAVVMPWIEAETWNDILTSRRELSVEDCRKLAENFAGTMMELEEHGLAHTDLSSSNVMIESTAGELNFQLVDLEDLYSPQLEEPDDLPDGIDGYRAPFLEQDMQWSPYVDRFSGGILIAEMLTWCEPGIREKCWGDSFFAPGELQQENERQPIMIQTLEKLYGLPVSGLFERLWNAEQIQQCPSFGEWSIVLEALSAPAVPVAMDSDESEEDSPPGVEPSSFLFHDNENAVEGRRKSREHLLDAEGENRLARARSIEQQGKLAAALWEYGRLIDGIPPGSSLHREIEIVISLIQEKLDEPEEEQITNIGKIREQYKATTDGGDNLYAKLWIVLLGASVVIIIVALLTYLL